MAGKGKPPVCYICGKLFDDENDKIKYKTHWVHGGCLNSGLGFLRNEKDDRLAERAAEQKQQRKNRSSTAKPKAEKKAEPVSQEEYVEKKRYYEYLRKLVGIDEPVLPAKMYALSEKYLDSYGLTFDDLYHTLVYMNEIIEKELTGDVVGLIPYYCDQAKKYYEELKLVEENNKNVDTTTMYQIKTVTITPKKRKMQQLDITSIV